MKMSQVLQAVGYPENLIREEQARESGIEPSAEKETDVNAGDPPTTEVLYEGGVLS